MKNSGHHSGLEKHGLDKLLKLLTRVKANGWSDAFTNHRERLDSDNRVQERLRRRLRTLRKASMPLVLEDGINRLPDELLVYIFEIGRSMNVPGDPSSFSSIHVSHVSLRFRRIALQTPSLWTTIHKVYGECQIREFIARSGGLDLDIKMHELNARISKCHSFLKAMKDTSRRWSSFCLTDMKEAAWPTMVELSIDSITPKTFLFNSQQEFLFPIASTIKLHIPHTIDVMTTLANLLQNREIVKIFKNCDGWTESEVEELTRKLLQFDVAQKGLQSLDIISCKKISDDFLLGLRDEVGDRLKWSL
ncbi:hypothetical protein BD410DRAFT_809204 [Rickenella mellea]|uniref:Uncharacterized protein n=1 Tax=Rickenella mellea TaxID=50990 RepID=A0A4Y7PKZ4_9AGAM|nr:hypothetical protein BD410DRAFT_809204 [Rickenella mellea]